MRRLKVSEQHGPTLLAVAAELEREARWLWKVINQSSVLDVNARSSMVDRAKLLRSWSSTLERRSKRAKP